MTGCWPPSVVEGALFVVQQGGAFLHQLRKLRNFDDKPWRSCRKSSLVVARGRTESWAPTPQKTSRPQVHTDTKPATNLNYDWRLCTLPITGYTGYGRMEVLRPHGSSLTSVSVIIVVMFEPVLGLTVAALALNVVLRDGCESLQLSVVATRYHVS
jgi:hypothetical protein